MSHRRLGKYAAAMFLLLSAAMPAAAEQFSPRIRAACTGDAQRLCPNQRPGTPEMRYCMEARGRALSANCVRALEDEGVIPRGYFRR
jgi:hypothetical protein